MISTRFCSGFLGRFACCALACLAWAATARDARGQEQDPEQLLKQMLDDAKQLAGRMPPRDRLPEWKLAWELPKGVTGAAASEEEYWQRTAQSMGFAGVSEAFARKMVDEVSKQMAAAGAAEGLTARDGIITLLLRVQGTDSPTAVKMLQSWDTSAALMRQADTLNPVGSDKSNADKSRNANRAILDAFAAPYAKLSDDELKDLFARQASLITKRTQMSYFKCNDWAGLQSATSESDLVKKGIWLGVVKIDLMIADRDKLTDPLDLKPENGKDLEERLNRAVRGVLDAVLLRRKREIDARAATAENELQIAEIQKQREKLYNEAAAAQKVNIRVEHEKVKNLGDNCYWVRITGVSPETAGLQASIYSGWIRRGEAMCEVTVGGNMPQEEMDKEMAHFLAEMDAALMDYDSSVAGALMMIAPPADSGPPPGSVAGEIVKAGPGNAQTGTGTGAGGRGANTGSVAGGGKPKKPKSPPIAGGGGGATGGGIDKPIPPPQDDPVEYAQGMAAYNSRDFAAAQRQFDQALLRNPNNPRVLMMRGATRYFQNDLNGAKEDYARAALLDPNNAALRRYWAFAELCAGDADIAAREADAAIALAPDDADAYLTRGQAAMAQDRPDEAQRYFRTALAKAPNRAQTLYDEAGVALQQKLYVPASLQFQTVLWLDPNSQQAWYGRAAALAARGKHKQAITAYQNYLKYDSTSPYATQARNEIARLKPLVK